MSPLKQATLTLALIVVAAGGWYVFEHPGVVGLGSENAADGGRQAGANGSRIPGLLGQGRAVNVVTALVAVDDTGDKVVAVGTAKAAMSVTIFPQVTGPVTAILFKPGEEVETGAPLLKLQDDEEQVALAKAKITLEQAQAALDRSKSLAQSKTISSVQLSDAEMAAQLAETGVQSAEIALSRRTVTAPFRGVTGLTDVSVGDMVTTTTAITALEDLSTIKVDFEVPERWTGRVVEAQPITATAQGLPGSEFSGHITGIDNHVDPTTRTLKLEAELTNFGGVLKGGMAITVTLEFKSNQELMVPSLAVQWDRRGPFVWKVVDAAARRADVAIVKRESGIVIVKGGIVAGDQVVVEGTQRLREGAKVIEVDESPAIAEDGATSTPQAESVPAASDAAAPAQTRG